MKIIVVGAAGDIGQAACRALEARHEIITVGRSRGTYRVDVADIEAVKQLYRSVGSFDAVVSCAGDTTFAPLEALDH
ncbi:hypothetical protein U879_01660 [Defluviimonas sp. 20V17]|uniref:NAD dependent epimerase/dehydratase family protein n=1 Tax=Allgaiera indica TaxID=765699 RepID=A0AAN5A0B7_9RHOB|nr:NAD-dependent epimerase/dehydratase family protein [Allgaiera indica]KDB05401.1 hypothetical protein U879_01660 [Defluviimonas sp. 20V17]GHE04124.1 hypothetical protein GCM10008024_29970 [Allgaiera indica]SDX49655.1 NAD dependent epimerase/dehydratase family protein [Allgaiera indica]